jgi:hypothetical protein
VSRLRWPLRIYIVAVLAAAIVALPAAAAVRSDLRPADTVLLALVMVMASAAQLWPVHISPKVKLTVDDTATFAAALLLGPFYAMLAAGASTLIAQHFRGLRHRWYNRGFNGATSTLATGAAGATYLALAGPNATVVNALWAVFIAAVAKYLIHVTLVDLAVALQVRRNPLTGWWRLHRRLLPYEAALLALGALASIATQTQPWTLALFAVPMAVVLFTLRDSARAREQTRSAVFEMAGHIDAGDPYMHGRSKRVADTAERLARRLKLDFAEIELIRSAARVHDIGKIGASEAIVQGPGPLIEDGHRDIRRHPEVGHRLLKHLGLREEAELILVHHERHDGGGYPRGLAGNKVPLEVAVLSIADAYDAMTTDRSYRKGLSWDVVRAELVRQRGKQWRDTVVDSFIDMLEEDRGAARIEPASNPASAVMASRRALP